MKNRPTCQIPCAYHALFRPFVRYAVYSMQKSTFLRFSASDPPGCLLDASGCLWMPLGASWVSPGCFLGVSWVSPGVSWMSPGCFLRDSWELLGVSWVFPGSLLDVFWVSPGFLPSLSLSLLSPLSYPLSTFSPLMSKHMMFQ